jgi:hypothetical protein
MISLNNQIESLNRSIKEYERRSNRDALLIGLACGIINTIAILYFYL